MFGGLSMWAGCCELHAFLRAFARLMSVTDALTHFA